MMQMDNNENKIFFICPQDTVVKVEFNGAYNPNYELKTKVGYYIFEKEENNNGVSNEN